MRRLGLLIAVVVLAALGALAAIAFFNARDDAGVGTPASEAPGVPVSELGEAAGQAPDVPEGNVVVLYSDAGARAPLTALAEDIAGPQSPELEEAGQAVIVREAPAAQGIVAIAGDRGVRVDDPADPQLRAFIEAHLGAAAG
jgi:hypothetical protein